MYRRLIAYLFSVVISLASAFAQEYTVSRRFSSADGLSNDFVLCLAVDGQGYVWAGTEAGVSRIAGETCNAFPANDAVNGLAVSALYCDKPSGQILIAAGLGLTIYNPTSGKVQNLSQKDGLVPSTIVGISETADGALLVFGNGEVKRLNCRTLAMTSLKIRQMYQNRCALDDGHGHLYLGHSHHGMSIVNLNNGSVKNFQHRPGDNTSLPGNNVRKIYQDDRQRIWVGTENGLALFNPKNGTFEKVTRKDKDYNENVYDILQMNDGRLWVATDMGGIRVVDPEDHQHYQDVKVKLSSVSSRSIVQDEYGNIWVGCHNTGVDFISTWKSNFKLLDYLDEERHARPVTAIAPGNGGFWTASETELAFWQGTNQTGSWSWRNMTQRELSFARCLMADRSGHVWIGIDDQGVMRFDRATGRFEPIPIKPEESDVHAFAEEADGSVWIGGEYGIYRYSEGKVERQEAMSKVIGTPATSFIRTDSRHLIITTLGGGVFSYDLAKNTFRHATVGSGLLSGKINQAVTDSKHRVWMATEGGLVCIDNPTELTGIHIIGRESGLDDIHVLALQLDGDGRVWMSTYRGISCYVESTGKTYNYNHLGPWQLNSFSPGAAATGALNTLFFGSASGVCYFNPMQMDNQQQMAAVQIIACEAYNPVGSNTERQLLIPDDKGRVTTTYRQNTLRLTFTVRNYALTEQVEYSYMMKGMDSKWYDVGNDYDVVFRGLRPGHYTFILRGKLKSQDWENARETRLEITIKPPFWRTWWAWLVYALLASALVWYLLHNYKHKLKLENSLELERRENQQKQELHEERLRFFTNVTHELRTPLTLILGPLEDLTNDKQLPELYKKKISLINKSAGRLRDLINQILEFRKTETQNRRLTVARGNLGKLAEEIGLYFKQLNRNPNVAINIDVRPDLPDVYFDSEVITTIINNLMSNAVKYTSEGEINLKVYTEGDRRLCISVDDTGCGIAKEDLVHIFDRYYQSRGKHQASGTGIGLALVKSLAELHEGTLTVDSKPDEGARFTFSIEMDNTYPNALHKEDVEETVDNENTETAGEDMRPLLLVVEDNDDIRQYIADSMGDDYRIVQSADGQEGWNTASEQIPDIIVSDIMMPKMNGIEMTKRLKEDMRTSHIPIILLTAKDTVEDKEEGYDSGADSYLTKPFSARLLQSRIENLLANRRRLAELIAFRTASTKNPAPITEEAPASEKPDDEPRLSRLDQEFIERLNSLIEENIMKEDIDMAFVTDKMAMSHSTFYRKVKALTGMTALEYIRKRRLHHCYRLIASGDYNVSQAAMMTGFNQMAHFRETFKKEFGILPSEVKKN